MSKIYNQEHYQGMNRIIAVPFAFDEGKKTSVNIHSNNPKDIYFKNACVACISAKHHNYDCDVVFTTNIPIDDIPEGYTKLLKENNINILTIPFDRFLFSDDYPWGLAFYKLCVLSHIIEMEYDFVCYLDCDVWIQHSFDPIWEECTENILLYDINHGLQVENYRSINSGFVGFSEEYRYITHYGGEFFAANKDMAILFCEKCVKIYEQMIQRKYYSNNGDEFILSLAAKNMKGNIKNAGAYIYRFWTETDFYLISTCYEYNPICVLHMPSEKKKGIIDIYEKYLKNGKMPKPNRVWKMCHICGFGRIIGRSYILSIIMSYIKRITRRLHL